MVIYCTIFRPQKGLSRKYLFPYDGIFENFVVFHVHDAQWWYFILFKLCIVFTLLKYKLNDFCAYLWRIFVSVHFHLLFAHWLCFYCDFSYFAVRLYIFRKIHCIVFNSTNCKFINLLKYTQFYAYLFLW